MLKKKIVFLTERKGFVWPILTGCVLFWCITASPFFSNASDVVASEKPEGGRYTDTKHNGVSSESGVTYIREIPFVRETLRDVQKRIRRKPETPSKQRTIPFHKRPPFVRLDKKETAFPEVDIASQNSKAFRSACHYG